MLDSIFIARTMRAVASSLTRTDPAVHARDAYTHGRGRAADRRNAAFVRLHSSKPGRCSMVSEDVFGTSAIRRLVCGRDSRHGWLAALALAVFGFAPAAFAQSSLGGSDIPSDPGVSLVGPGTSAQDVPIYVEYDKKVRASEQVTPLTSDFFGEQVAMYSGQTEFGAVDVDIPGNSALPVQLRRRLVVSAVVGGQLHDKYGGLGNALGGAGDWDVDVPYISGVFDLQFKWDIPGDGSSNSPVPRCSVGIGYPRVTAGFSVHDVWSGASVHVPGQGDKEILQLDARFPPQHFRADRQVHKWTTSDFDSFTCTQTRNGHGEGFVMTTPQGVTYTFDTYVERAYPAVTINGHPDYRVQIFLLASRVTDRYGNYVTYEFDPASSQPSDSWRVVAIKGYTYPN
ncbi:MAG TPA: hypothetical protein VGC30_08495, partial [Dokdonella sp.]